MKWIAQIFLGLGTVFLVTAAWADDLAMSGNPYDSIVARNIFSLVPMPTNPPSETKPPDPPAKITPNGIMKLFGELQVLFKVATPPKPGQPPQDQSYVMSEGDRQDGIAVTKIDESAGMITFDNHGVIQQLPLQAASNVSAPAATTGPGPNSNPSLRRFGRLGRNRDIPQGNTPSSYTPPSANPVSNSGAATFAGDSAQQRQDQLSPEAQVLVIEAQRLQALQQQDPVAKILPLTPLTPQVTGQNNDGDTPTPPNPEQGNQ